MATQTLFADVCDAIITTWGVEATLAAEVAAETLRIFDGPPVEDRTTLAELILGAYGDEFEETTEMAQSWATAGGAASAQRDEEMDIPCCVWVFRGDTGMSATRRRAVDLFNAASTAVRGQSLGLPMLMWAETAAGAFTQVQSDQGVAVILRFTVRARVRLFP